MDLDKQVKTKEKQYIQGSDIKFTHGICPDCYNKLYSAKNEKRQKY